MLLTHIPGRCNGIPLLELRYRSQSCLVAILIPSASLARQSTIRRLVWSSLLQRYRGLHIFLLALMAKQDTSESAGPLIPPASTRKYISNVLPLPSMDVVSILHSKC